MSKLFFWGDWIKNHFIGILANVDKSILDLELDHGFKIERGFIGDEDYKIVSEITRSDMFPKLINNSCISSEYDADFDDSRDVIYYIKNKFKEKELSSLQKNFRFAMINSPEVVFHPSSDIDNLNKDNPIFNYLYPIIRKIRLFQEGNICMPFQYCYAFHKDKPNLLSGIEYGSYVLPEPHFFEKSEIDDLNIHNIKIPFDRDFLQLAFENFELSYEIQNRNMQFLILMNGLESLFHPSHEGELTFRISRNAAVLLGKNKEDSITIQTDMKELYSKRSQIVHRGKADISEQELLKLRNFAKKSIKEIYKMDKNKKELLDLLTQSGFGERPWLKD